MDEGVPEGGREGDDSGAYRPLRYRLLSSRRIPPGLNIRIREAEKRPCTLRPRVGPDDGQGHEAYCGDQEQAGACILETQVRLLPALSMRHLTACACRMAAAKEKLRAHRKKKLEKTTGVKLVQPITADASLEKVREKIKVAAKSRSALVQGEGRSMAMEID